MKTIKSSFFSFFRRFCPVLFLLTALQAFAADRKFCSQCSSQIRAGQRYMISNGKVFCSRECYIQTLPECTICGKRSFTGGIYAMDHSFFACTDCMKLPRCFSCQFPTRTGTRLSAGRVICAECGMTAVSSPAQAETLFREVRDTMRFSLGIVTKHPIRLTLTDPVTLHKLSGARSDMLLEQGLFRYNVDVERVTSRDYLGRKTGEKLYKKNELIEIYVLDHLPKIRMEHVMAHELAHDWMTAFYPGIREEWIKEGFAESIAWRYNRHKKRNKLHHRIENNPDPVYGEVFRRIRKIAQNRGFAGLKKFLEFKSNQNLKK